MREAEFREALAAGSIAYPHRRFRVYRNNIDGALCNALRVRFPVVERLLGRQEFAQLAALYTSASLPQSPVLIGYGHTFPEFIEKAGRGPAYLSDVARLENCWWEAYHAAEGAILEPEQFQQVAAGDIEELHFAFHPSAAFVDSPWRIGSIWEAVKQGKSLEGLDPCEAEMVLVRRPHADVLVNAVKDPSRTMLRALMAGNSLAEAVEATLTAHPDIDLEAELRMLISSQIISDVRSGNSACGQ